MTVAFETGGAVTTTSTLTSITGGNNAKSAYTQLIASSGIAAKLLYVIARFDTNGNGTSHLIDIATGAAASEVVLIPDIFYEPAPAAVSNNVVVWGPYLVDIVSGTRFAARVESNTTFQSTHVGIILASERLPDLTSPAHLAYGITTGSSPKGVAIDGGGTANTKGAYAQLTASFSATGEHIWFLFGTNGNSAMDDAEFLVDIAIGAGGAEVVKIANIHVGTDITDDATWPKVVGPFPANIFQGQRIAARCQSTSIDATDRVISVAIQATQGTVVTGGSTIYVGAQNTQVFPVGGGLPSGSRF